MGLFGKSKHQKICEHIAGEVLGSYEHMKSTTKRNNDRTDEEFAFYLLHLTARVVISILYENQSPEERQSAMSECTEKLRQHLTVGATIGLVDICTICHGCTLGLQESYTATMNRYIQILYKKDVLRFDIEGRVYNEELKSWL